MDWKSNIIKEKYFRRLVLFILSLFLLLTVWAGIKELQNFHTVFDNSTPTNNNKNTFKIGNLVLSKTNTSPKEEEQEIVRYVTVQDLTYSPSKKGVADILNANYGFTKMMGLMGYPSFLVKEHNAFWKSQFYLEIGFRFGGWLILGILFIIVTVVNFRQEKRLFTGGMKRLFLGIYFLIFSGFIVKALLYGRLMHFLNSKYYLGESLAGGISPGFLFLSIALLLGIIFLERAIPMQKEQDLTI